MTFVELKFTLEKWSKGEFVVCGDDVKGGVTVFRYSDYIKYYMFYQGVYPILSV